MLRNAAPRRWGGKTVTNAKDIGRNERRRSSRHEASYVIRNELRARNVMQERRSKFVGGESHRVRKGGGKAFKLETICAQGMPPIIRNRVQSNLNVQTPRDVSFSFLLFHF